MKIKLQLITLVMFFYLDGFSQFEKKSLHSTLSVSSYFGYGAIFSYFPAKNLEVGLGTSFRSGRSSFGIYNQRSRWAVNSKINYYFSDWVIKPKIVCSVALAKNSVGDVNDQYPLKYRTLNAGLGIGISGTMSKKFRFEADITRNAYNFKREEPVVFSPTYNFEVQNPSNFIVSITLSYKLLKSK